MIRAFGIERGIKVHQVYGNEQWDLEILGCLSRLLTLRYFDVFEIITDKILTQDPDDKYLRFGVQKF